MNHMRSNHRHKIRFQGIVCVYVAQWLFIRHLYSNLGLLFVWELDDFTEVLLKREWRGTGYIFLNELKYL